VLLQIYDRQLFSTSVATCKFSFLEPQHRRHTPPDALYALLGADEPKHIDGIAERSSLNSSEVLATLFNLEMKDIIRQLPGNCSSKILL